MIYFLKIKLILFGCFL